MAHGVIGRALGELTINDLLEKLQKTCQPFVVLEIYIC